MLRASSRLTRKHACARRVGLQKHHQKDGEENNIRFMSTPMSRGAAKILTEINVDIWKIGSGDILDFVLLDYLEVRLKSFIEYTK